MVPLGCHTAVDRILPDVLLRAFTIAIEHVSID